MTIASLRGITSAQRWRFVAGSVLSGTEPFPATPEDFGTYWIEAGHRIREQVADDRLLAQLLRQTLPRCQDNTATLYRGENQDRWRAGTVGFAWTRSIETARVFGRGLNAVSTGGVLLRGVFASEAIISGPNGHSTYLQENQYTVDPHFITGVEAVEFYPPA